MTDHKNSAKTGTLMGEEFWRDFFSRPATQEYCKACFGAGVTLWIIGEVLANTEMTEDEMLDYISDLAAAMLHRAQQLRKEAGHEDPPKFPDKRTLN